MAEIPLTRGKVAIVDDADFEWLNTFNWYAERKPYRFYAVRKPKTGAVRMHRLIMNAPAGFDVDHINGDGLDNRRRNLRIATRSQNNGNVGLAKTNKTGFRGVSQRPETGTYRAGIWIDGRQRWLCNFIAAHEAALAYNAAAIVHFGEFARLNKVDESR